MKKWKEEWDYEQKKTEEQWRKICRTTEEIVRGLESIESLSGRSSYRERNRTEGKEIKNSEVIANALESTTGDTKNSEVPTWK